MSMGKLQIFPNLLDKTLDAKDFLVPPIGEAVQKIKGLIAESEKEGRRFLRRFISREALDHVKIRTLSEHTKKEDLVFLLEPIQGGETWGLISDAGLACIADPGSGLIQLAHLEGVSVETFSGPCSIIFALQLSGFSGQNFSFHGYLPREPNEREEKIRALEKEKGTKIWIEAPYRSNTMLETCIRVLSPGTFLCIASNLTSPNQSVISLSVKEWRARQVRLEKEPVTFLIS